MYLLLKPTLQDMLEFILKIVY